MSLDVPLPVNTPPETATGPAETAATATEHASPAPFTMDILLQRQIDNRASGNGAYLETFLRAARSGGFRTRVIFAPVQSFGNRPWAGIHPQLAAHIDEAVWPRTLRAGGRYWSLSPQVWARFTLRLAKEALLRIGLRPEVRTYLGQRVSTSDARAVGAICNAAPADLTVAEYSSMAPALDEIDAPTLRACLMHDLLSARSERFEQTGQVRDFDALSLETELGWISSCDLLVFASANEMETVRRYLPDVGAAWLPPDAPGYVAKPQPGPARIVFFGTQHAGNHDALEHFLADIWPLVHQARPDTEFWIGGSVGAMLSPEQAALPGVCLLGRVDDLGDLGGAQSIGIAPARLATGVSIKLAEYLVLKMPAIAYPRALEGFGSALDDLVRIAATPEAFADEVISLLDSEESRLAMSRRAETHIAERLSNARAARLMADAVHLQRAKAARG